MNSVANSRYAWCRSTLAVALVGSLLLWAALPPLALGWLGWIAPLPWLLLVRGESLPGRRPFLALWLAGFVFWLMAIHWLRLPHPATSLGWFALSAYLAFYLPVFVGLSRVAVHRLSVPLWLAAPVVWTGLELARAHLLTGFLMASLAHTQVNFTPLIQISDLVGEYGVDFIIMLVAASIFGVIQVSNPESRAGSSPTPAGARPSATDGPRRPARWQFRPLAITPAVIALGVTLGYGYWRLSEAEQRTGDAQRTIRIALIQGNSLAEWKADPSREQQIMDEYLALSDRAVALAKERGDGQPLDLVVWPETMFRTGLVSFDAGYELPPGVNRSVSEIEAYGRQDLASLVSRLQTPVLVGIDRVHLRAPASPGTEPPPPRRFNSAVLVDRDGEIIGTYDKVHRVMFGEYVPFADRLPFLYRLTPLTGGIDAGSEPAILELKGTFFAPNICYETAMPHVIRRQAATRVDDKEVADVLVNLTNDAWYWGSSELDMHLACGVFRAVETRKPLVIAANGGISAWIDHLGRIRAQSPRQQPDVILADVEPTAMPSLYVEYGDWFAGACLSGCVLLAIVGGISRRGAENAEKRMQNTN